MDCSIYALSLSESLCSQHTGLSLLGVVQTFSDIRVCTCMHTCDISIFLSHCVSFVQKSLSSDSPHKQGALCSPVWLSL